MLDEAVKTKMLKKTDIAKWKRRHCTQHPLKTQLSMIRPLGYWESVFIFLHVFVYKHFEWLSVGSTLLKN